MNPKTMINVTIDSPSEVSRARRSKLLERRIGEDFACAVGH
jgi:hypothetical protein